MPTNDENRRQYFRIEDTLGIHFEVMSESEAKIRQASFDLEKFNAPSRLQHAERHLQLLIDKLRIQNPNFAEAIDLLNMKFNVLKESQIETALEYGSQSFIKKVNLSASGISFDDKSKIEIGRKMYLDMTLLPTDLHIQTMGTVVGCRPSDVNENEWSIRVEFFEIQVMLTRLSKKEPRQQAWKDNI